MTSQTKTKVRWWAVTIGALLPALGWGSNIADSRYVHRDVYEKHVTADSMTRVKDSLRRVNDSVFKQLLLTKVDSTNQRLQQMVCGDRIAHGCR